MQQTFIEMRACDAHLIGQLEATFKITRRNALIEKIGVLAVFFFEAVFLVDDLRAGAFLAAFLRAGFFAAFFLEVETFFFVAFFLEAFLRVAFFLAISFWVCPCSGRGLEGSL